MSAHLPAIETAISQWHQWQAKLPGEPKIVCELGQGLSNQSYLLQAGETYMVLRLNSSRSQLPGIDRQREAAIWHAASRANIAPTLLHADDQYLVSSFVQDETFSPGATGKTWTREDLTKDDLTAEVFRVMSKCHAIEVDASPIDYAQHIQTYWTTIEQNGIDTSGHDQTGRVTDRATTHLELVKQREAMQDALDTLLNQHPAIVICHHDPVVANFVGSHKQLYLIDWEYAAKGLAVIDYAALAVEWGFSDAVICTHTHTRLDSLVMAKKLYRYMCQLWKVAAPVATGVA